VAHVGAPSILAVLGVNRDRLTGHGIPLITMIAFLIGSVVSISSIWWTVTTTKELALSVTERSRIFTLSLFYTTWLAGNPENVIRLAGSLLICAAVAVLFVRLGVQRETERSMWVGAPQPE